MAKRVRRVAFDQVVETIERSPGQTFIRTRDELRPLWYSREELVKSCSEAKSIVRRISALNGDLNSIDHSQVCVVGLEKQFHGKKERDKYRKLLVKSVLIRQEMNRGLGLENDAHSLCEISEMISASFKEFALWQAAMHQFHALESSTSDGSADPRPPPEKLQQQHPAKRQKIAGGCSPEAKLEQEALVTMQRSKGMTRSESQLLIAEMQHFVEGYCSR